MRDMDVRIERRTTLHAIYIHALSDTPEEDAMNRIITWAEAKGLHQAQVKPRLFGRNSYPTDNPEPHGYECFLTVSSEYRPQGDFRVVEIDGGVYAVLRFTNLFNIQDAWQHLWNWIKEHDYEHSGMTKGKHGWVNGFEEYRNWYEHKPPDEWEFDLWAQLTNLSENSSNHLS
jgi:DNA gyrase inhibitor GyrI